MSVQFGPNVSTQMLVVPTTASTTTIGTPFNVQAPWDALVLMATLIPMSAGTLDIYIQESWDGATTWSDVVHFAQIAAGAATAVASRIVVARPAGAGSIKVVGTGGTPALAAASFCDGPWGPLLRMVAVTGAGANALQQTQTFKIVPWQQST